MSRVFISFLGTNDYLECSYKFQDDIVKNIRFVQEATIKFNCMKWSENDRVIIFTTKEAFEKNWKDNGHRVRESGKPLERIGLKRRIDDLNLDCDFKQIDISDGTTESEIWEIFSIVFRQINQEDTIIIDITHAFRSIPMLAMVILNYARVIKNISLQGWFYGAMESLGSYNVVKEMPLEKRVIPIFDLTSFDQLMEWSNGIDQFLKSGNASKISRLAQASTSAILAKTKGKDWEQNKIRGFAKALDQFTRTLSTCRGRDISYDVIKLKQYLEDCEKIQFDNHLNRPLQPLLKKIEAQLAQFEKSPANDGIQAAKWCLEHNLIQQGYTILQETLVTYFITMIGEDPENFDNKNRIRTIANQAVVIFLGNKKKEEWGKESKDNSQLTCKFLDLYKTLNIELLKTYRNLTEFRNDINHCGFNEHPKPVKTFENNLNELITSIEKYISA